MRMSVWGSRSWMARNISPALVTGRWSTKGTVPSSVGPETRVTLAPRSMASRAMA